MHKIISDPELNDTTEMFSRNLRGLHTDQFVPELSEETRKHKRATRWLLLYLIALFLAVWFIPEPRAKVAVTPPVDVLQIEQVIPSEYVHRKAFKACPSGTDPVWIDKTTIQCLKEKP